MAIKATLDEVLAKRGMGLTELAERIGLKPVELSMLNRDQAEAIRFSTLNAICDVLDCQPGDLFAFERETRGGETV